MDYSQKSIIPAPLTIPGFQNSLAPDFEKVAGCLQVVQTPEFIHAWHCYVRMFPQELYERLTRGLPYRTIVSFNINLDGTGYIIFKLIDNLEEVAEAHRCFSINKKEADNNAFIIWRPEDRGIGIAKAVLRNTFALYRDWGIKIVRCGAGVKDGAYTWARYGFKVSKIEWADLQLEVTSRLYSLDIPWHLKQEVQRLINLDDPMGLWFISDLAILVQVDDAYSCGVPRTCSLGRALLEGLHWKGQFEFDDADCMKRFGLYMEGAS